MDAHETSAPELYPGAYERLMAAKSSYDEFDRHIFARIIAHAMCERDRPLTEALGLTRDMLSDLLESIFPGAYKIDELVDEKDADGGKDAIEEEDFRRLFLDGASSEGKIPFWLSRIISRRALLPFHMWRILGTSSRDELSLLLKRHFAPFAARNDRNMRWKKFFYREMCQRLLGKVVCKSPVCDICPDYRECFSPED